MPRQSHSPVDAAASLLLTGIASRGKLFEVLDALGLLPKVRDVGPVRLQTPEPLSAAALVLLTERLEQVLPQELVQSVERRAGRHGQRMLERAVEQLRLVASFALSDGGAVIENVQAVERFVQSGGVEMFAAA